MDDEIRAPDANKIDRLLSPFSTQEEDELEFVQALELSRREFLEYQIKLQKEEKEKERLHRDLGVPMSRLHLWLRNSKSVSEKEYLEFIIKRVNHRLYNDLDTMPTLKENQANGFLHFLTTQLSPLLFSDVIQICRDCTNPVFQV